MKNHTVNLELSDTRLETSSELSCATLLVRVYFAFPQKDVHELSVRVYNSDYHFLGSDVISKPTHGKVNACRFFVPVNEECLEDHYYVFVYKNSVPRWFGNVMFTTRFDDKARSFLENLSDLPFESMFINQIALTDWWNVYDAMGVKNRMFTLAFLSRVRLYLTNRRHSVWSSFPSWLVCTKDWSGSQCFVEEVLAGMMSEGGRRLHFIWSDLAKGLEDWERMIDTLKNARVVTVNLESFGIDNKYVGRLAKLVRLISKKYFEDIPFIFYGLDTTIRYVQVACEAFHKLMRPESTFYLAVDQWCESVDGQKKELDHTYVDSTDTDDFQDFLDDFMSDQFPPFKEDDLEDVDKSVKEESGTELLDSHPAAVKSAKERLMQLIGLERVKCEIEDTQCMTTFLMNRKKLGLDKDLEIRNHMFFMGNPGTGKTTVAKLIGEMYHEMGILSMGHTVVTDRSRLVGNFIGETERLTNEAIEEARGGVLFIDEAYTLFSSKEDDKDFGKHVLECLLTVLSEPNPDMIVIFAGYEDKMEHLLDFNPGIKDRFPIKLHFADYTSQDLMNIARSIFDQRSFILTEAAEKRLIALIDKVVENRDAHFGNGRWVHNLVEHGIIKSVAKRVMSMSVTADDETLYTLIHECDIVEAEKLLAINQPLKVKLPKRIGFTA